MGPLYTISLTCLLTLLSAGTLHTQWVQTNGPYGGKVLCFTERPNGAGGANIFAGTNYGGVFCSTDDGISWTSSGLLNKMITGLAIIDTLIFAGSSGSGVFRSSDNGASWSPVNEGLTWLYIKGLGAFGSSLFAGTAFGVFLSTNNGTTWTTITSGMTYPDVQAFAVIGADVFAGGAGVYRSTDNGTNWTPAGLHDTTVYSFAVRGTNLFAGTSTGVFRSTDNGISWSSFSSGLPSVGVWALAAAPDGSGGSILFAGSRGTYLSTDGGTNWTATNLDTTIAALSFSVNPAGDRILAGMSAGVFRSSNRGTNWSGTSSGLTNSCIRALGMSPAPGGAGMDRLFAGGDYGGVFVSSNGGVSWTAANAGLPSGLASFPSCFAVTATAGANANIFAGMIWDKGVFRSTDYGETWSDANTGLTDGRVEALAVSPADDDSGMYLFAGTWSGVFRSTNYGVSWSHVLYSGTAIIGALAVGPNGSGGVNVFAGGLGSGGGRAFFSSNNGSSWSDISSGLPYGAVLALAVGPDGRGGTNVLAGTWGGGVYRSSNNGSSWIAVDSGLSGSYVRAMLAVPNEAGGTYFFAGTNNQEPTTGEGVFFSSNNGDCWTPVNSGLVNLDISSLALSPHGPGGMNLVAGTSYAGVWRQPLAEIVTSVQPAANTVPTGFSLQQNYPNPFNPSTTINYQLPAQSHVMFKVFDVLGREVATLVNGVEEPGYKSVDFNANTLASGVYYYRLQAGNYVETKKSLLLR